MSSRFYKNNENDQIWWLKTDAVGVLEFSFDKEHTFNLFADYPQKLTEEQQIIFDRENPYWADFFDPNADAPDSV